MPLRALLSCRRAGRPARTAWTVGAALGLAPGGGFADEGATSLQQVAVGGAQVVLAPDRAAPVVSVAIVHRTGAADDPPSAPGATLVANALGHRELARLAASRGGRAERAVSATHATSVVTLPSQEIDLALWIAGRRITLVPTDAAVADAAAAASLEARAAVASPIGAARHRLHELALQGVQTRERPAASAPDVVSPSAVRDALGGRLGRRGAVIAVVGDFDSDRAARHLGQLLGDATDPPLHGGSRPADSAASDTRQSTERLSVVAAPALASPAVLAGWAVPPHGHGDRPALEMALQLLAGAPRSRLGDALAAERGALPEIRTTIDEGAPALASIELGPGPWARVAVLDDALRALRRAPPGAAEVDAARAALARRARWRLDGPAGRALALAEARADGRDPRHAFRDADRWNAVTPASVRRAVQIYLADTRRTVVEVQPPTRAVEVEPKAPRDTAASHGSARAPDLTGEKSKDSRTKGAKPERAETKGAKPERAKTKGAKPERAGTRGPRPREPGSDGTTSKKPRDAKDESSKTGEARSRGASAPGEKGKAKARRRSEGRR